MAPSLEFHFFPANDLNGDPLLVITDEDPFFKKATLKPQLYGLGGLELTLARHTGWAIFDTDALKPEVFVRVLLKSYSDTDYYPNVGAFLDKRSQIVVHVDENGAEEITLGGPGPKYYLDRYALGLENNTGFGYQLDLENGVWRWSEDATMGKVLSRIISEDEAADVPALVDLTESFGFVNDSDSVAWVDNLTGPNEYEIPIGTTLLQALWDMEDLGNLYTDIGLGSVGAPEFVLNAHQTYGRNRVGSSFGSGVTLLREGVNITNKALELEGIALKNATHVIIEGKDGVWADVQKAGWSPGDYVKWAKISFPRSSKLEALHQAGIRWLRRQDSGQKEITVEILPGYDVPNGLYFPGPTDGIWLGDSISVDTTIFAGGSPLDLNPSESQTVTGFELTTLDVMDDANQLTRARSWQVSVDLNKERGGSPSHPDQSSAVSEGHACRCVGFAPICIEQEPDTESVLSDSVDDPSDWPGSLTTAGSCWASANHKSMGASGGACAQVAVSAGDKIRAELDLKEETGNDSWENVSSYAYHAALQFEGPGQPVLTYLIVNQLYHNTGCINVQHSTTQTVPTGYTSARLRMYSRLGGWRYNGRIIEVTVSDPVVNHPFCLVGTGSSPFAARSDDPRFHTVHNAADVEIADAGSYFTGTDVEAALQELGAAAGGSGAPTTADYLVGTAQAGLSAEIVVGTSPGGELGGTWAAPTVDTAHSGSSHAGVIATHEAASDPHTGYRLESADHSHASTGLQGGTVSHDVLTGVSADDHHNESHQSRHNNAGADALKLDDLATPDDNTDLDATTSRHGLMPKPTGSTSTFYRSDGTQAAPVTGTGIISDFAVRKSSNEVVNNSTAFQDDNDLILPLAANAEWAWEMNLWFDSGTTPDIKFQVTVPAGATGQFSGMGLGASGSADNEGPTYAYGATATSDSGLGIGTIRHRRFVGYVKNGATPGNLTLQWAQNTLSATDTTMRVGSMLTGIRFS